MSNIERYPAQNPELVPQKFDAVVALGKNWRLPVGTDKTHPKGGGPRVNLSIESKITTLAAAELYLSGRANKIIFSTGKTAGKDAQGNDYPTEAEAMYEFMRRSVSEEAIPDSDVILETTSFDTAGNAEEVKKILDRENIGKNIAVLTIGYHSFRAGKLFENYGLKTKVLRSEDVLGKANERYSDFYIKAWRRKLFSEHNLDSIKAVAELGLILLKEAVASGLVLSRIDSMGTGLTRKLTQKSRHREVA